MHLELAQAAFGTTATVDIRLPVSCERCEGSGCEPGTGTRRAATFWRRGRGTRGAALDPRPDRDRRAVRRVRRDRQPSDPVSRVPGRRLASHSSRSIDVEVPAGVDDGQRLRLTGSWAGGAARSGVPGDLYVTVRVAVPTPSVGAARVQTCCTQRRDRVRRRPPWDRHLDRGHARRARRRSPCRPGTQPGHLFRLKGRGVPALQWSRPRRPAGAASTWRSRLVARRGGRGAPVAVRSRLGAARRSPHAQAEGGFSRLEDPRSTFGETATEALGPPATTPAEIAAAARRLRRANSATATSRIDGDDGHHLQRARRLRCSGESVTAADGDGHGGACSAVSPVAEVRAHRRLRRAPIGRWYTTVLVVAAVVLGGVFAPAKGEQAGCRRCSSWPSWASTRMLLDARRRVRSCGGTARA